MSQLDLEQLELEGEEHLAENLPAPGKATLTSRIGKPQRAGAGDLIDGDAHAQLAGGLGVELSRGDGGGNGGAGTPKKLGAAVGFLSGGRSDLAMDATADQVDNRAAGRGLDYLASQQREVVSFDGRAGDNFYDQRATVDAKLTSDSKLHKPFKKKADEEHEGGEDEADDRLHKPFMPDVMKTPTPGGPVPIPYPNVAAPGGADLKSQQRAVTQFDSAGDFYDQRATVDPTAAKESQGEEAAHKPIAPGSDKLHKPILPNKPDLEAPSGDLKSQQRAVTQFDSAGDFYDQRATVDPTAAKEIVSSNTSGPATAITGSADVKAAGNVPLAQQQRAVTQFDSAGDFYDQRATVEPTKSTDNPGAPASSATVVNGTAQVTGAAASFGKETFGVNAAEGTSNAATTAKETGAASVAAADTAITAAMNAAEGAAPAVVDPKQEEAQKAHEAMHVLAGGGAAAIEKTLAAGNAAQAANNLAPVTAGANNAAEQVGMINPDLKPGQGPVNIPLDAINPDLKKPAKPDDGKDIPLDAINPDLKKPAKPDDGKNIPLDAINPDLKKPGKDGKPGEVPLDAINPDLKKKPTPGNAADGKDIPLDAINPDLIRRGGGLLDPYEDEPIFDLAEFESFPGDAELKKQGQGGDPDARPVDPTLDGKVDQAKANPQATKEILKGVKADAATKTGVIKQGVDAKTSAVGKAQAKGVSGAAAKGGKKVSTVAGKGGAAVDKAKGQGAAKKVEKAKNIEELKTRLEAAFKEEKAKLEETLKKQKADLETKIKAEQDKIDAEMKTQADRLAKEIATKNADIDKQLAEKKKAYDKQIADDKKKAEKTCKDEQKKTQQTTDKEVAKIQKQGDSEAQKVIQGGQKEAAAARAKANNKANAAIGAANNKAAGIEDAAAKQQAQARGQQQANAARAAGNAEASQITAAAKAEADKRKELTKQLVQETKDKGKQAIADLDKKLQDSINDLNKKATDGIAKMDAERKKMVAEVKAFEDKQKAEHAKKNEEAKFKIHTLKLDSEKRIKDMETNGLKGITTKHDDMLVKLEKGSAADLAKLEEETNKICGEIKMSVAATTKQVNDEIALAQQKAAHEAKKRTDAIKQDGDKQIADLQKKVQDVEKKIAEIDAETANGLKKAGEKVNEDLKAKGDADRNAIVAGADKAVANLAKTSDQYEADKKAEEEAARKAKEEEERKKAEEEKAKADAEKKKEEEKKAAEEQKKKDFEAKTAGAADALFKAMDGWGTDEKAIMGALKGKSPEEIAAIKAAYEKKTGRSLDKDLADEMSGTDLKEAKALMSADPVQGAVAQLQSAIEGWGTDEAKIKSTLDGITDPEMKKKVIAEYEKATGQRLQAALEEEGISASDGVDVEKYAKEEEKPDPNAPKRELSDAEKSAANTAVTELEGAMHRWGTDEAAVFNALKGKSPEQIQMMKDAYFERHKPKTLDSILEDELSGTDLKEAKALMSADPVQAAVAQLQNAADGLGTDDEKIIATLKDIKDPELRKKVAEQYEKQTGDKLDAMLKDEMSGNDGDLAKALVGDKDGKVNQGEVAAIEADKAMHGGFLTDISDGIADTVGVDRKVMRSVTGGVVTAVVLGPLAGPVLAMGGGAVIGTDIGGTDEEALYKALESCETPEQREQLKKMYKERTGQDLDAALKSELTAKEKDVTDALMAGDKTTAEAAKMAAAADGLGTDRKALYASLEGKSKEEREAIIKKFDEKYAKDWPKQIDPKTGKEISPFQAMCADELDELDQKKAAMIAENGKMNDGFAAYYAMNEGFLGIGTDDDLLKSRLQGKSKEEILQIQKEYLRAKCEAEGKPVPPDLDKMTADNPALQALNQDIAGETSGRVGHQLKQAMKGNPTTPEEALQRAQEDRDFERKESGWIGEVGMAVLLGPHGYLAAKAMGVDPADISNGLTDMWSDSGKQLDADVKKLEADIAKAKEKYANDASLQGLSPEERKKKLDELIMKDLKGSGQLDFVAGSQKQYEEAKDATADAAGTAVAIAVGAIITVASGGTAAPALVALISGLAGVSAKMIISGASMSNEQLVTELAQVAAEALAAGIVNTKLLNTAIGNVAKKFGDGLAAKIIQEALEEAIESGAEEIINALLDPNLYKGDLVDFATQLGGRVGKAVLTGAGAAVVSTGFGDLMPGMNTLAGKGIHGKAAAGAINQAVGAAFTTAIDPNTYNGSGADVAMAFGKSMGSAALRGLQDGYSTGEGFKSGEGWKSGPSQKVDTKSSSPNNATATTTTTGTTTSSKGDTAIDAKTEVKVDKSDTNVKVDAKGSTTVSGPDGTTTATDSTSKTIPLDNKTANDPNNQVDPGKIDPNSKTQPIDADTLADTDPQNKNKLGPADGKVGNDPNSTVAIDTAQQTQAEVDAAKKAQAGNDIKALDAAVKALPGTSGLEVVADGTTGPLAKNQITASDAKKLIVMLDAALKTEVGRDAVKALQDLGITLTMQAGKGSFRQGDRINIDPTMASDANELAGILAHEAHHAKTFDAKVDINSSRDQYIEQTLRNEAEAQAALFEHYQQTGSIKGAQNQFGAAQFFAAYDAAAKAFRDANPNATDAEVHAHAKEAGTKALETVFGNAVPSTSVDKQGKLIPGKPKNYAELYGDFHDNHSPNGTKAQSGQKVDANQAAPQVTPVENEPVPQDGPGLRKFLAEKFGHIVEKFNSKPKVASAEFDGLIAELSAMEPGELGKPENKAKAKEILDRWMAIAAQLEAKNGSEAELRELYNIIEKQQMPVWIKQMEGMPVKQQAELISKLREELKLFIRDTMSDTKSAEVLYLRDLALYGHRNGPQMDKLLADALKKTNGNVDAAYKLIIESAMRSNKDVNKGITGNESGIKGDQKSDPKGPQSPAVAKQDQDPGGRDAFLSDDPGVEAEQAKFLAPGGKTPANLDALVEARGRPDLKDTPGTPEHMQARWNTSDAKAEALALGEDLDAAFKSWAGSYKGAMKASLKGNQAEKEFAGMLRDTTGGRKQSVETNKPVKVGGKDGPGREVDMMIRPPDGGAPVMIQLKSGLEDAGDTPRINSRGEESHSNPKALDLDQQLLANEQASQVIWVFQEIPSGPLIKLAGEKASATDGLKIIIIGKKADIESKLARSILIEVNKELKESGQKLTRAEIDKKVSDRVKAVMQGITVKASTTAAIREIKSGLMPQPQSAAPVNTDQLSDSQSEGETKTTPPATGLQSSNDLDVLYAQAAEADPILRGITNSIASQTGGQPMFPPGLKGKPRAMEKIAGEYGGDASKIVDLSRASIVYDNFQALQAGLAALEAQGVEIVRNKDRFAKPTASGYRDITLNVKINGHVCELQLHLKQIMEVKQGKGHELYEQSRAIEAKAQIEKRDLTAEEAAQIKAIESQAKALYDAAFDSAMNPGPKTDPNKPKPPATGPQSSNDLDTLYQQAAEADPILRNITKAIASDTGGEPMFPPGLKGKPRAMEKIAGEYGGDASKIVDLSRASIVYDNFQALQAGLAALQAQGVEIVKTKDRFDKPTASGYRDITLNVKINGHVCELQLHLKQIMEVKQGKGHELYEKSRAIEAKAQIEKRDLTAEENAQIKAIEAEAKALYDAAFNDAMTPKTKSELDTKVDPGEQATHKDDHGITAAAVPGSSFKGKTLGSPHPDLPTKARAAAEAAAKEAGLKFDGLAPDGKSFKFIDASGKTLTVRVETVPLEGDEVAFSIVNPTKDAHVIQVSNLADPKQMERAMAHEIAEILAIRERNAKGMPTRVDTDTLTGGNAPIAGSTLSPHDKGRLAEIEVLTKQIKKAQDAGDAHGEAELRKELQALVEHLGLRKGTPGAEQRQQIVDLQGKLSEAAKQLLADSSKPEGALSDADRKALEESRKTVKDDAEKLAKQENYERPMIKTIERPANGKSEKVLAEEAAAKRQKKSDEVVAKLRADAAKASPGLVKIKNPQIGGGASVAALSPGQFFIDARGRWQKDASGKIAQTAHQLGDIKDAGIGDPSQFAKPDERVSLDAINFMQDSLAAEANCINGSSTIEIQADGKMIMTIIPTDANGDALPAIKVEIEGTPTFATGFAPENIPRGDQSMGQNLAALTKALTTLGTDKSKKALDNLPGPLDDVGFAKVLDDPGLRAELENLAKADPKLAAAISAVDATKKFLAAQAAHGEHKVMLGQDANLLELLADKEKFLSVTHWVIAGTGGTGISAAEIILHNNPKAKVTMVGRSITAGLADNDQFKRVMADHGPGGDGRFEVVTGQTVDTIKDGTKPGEFGAGGQVKASAAVDKAIKADAIPDPKSSDSWLVDASNPEALKAVNRILTENPKAKVTIIGKPEGDGVKQQLADLFKEHGATGSKRLELVTSAGTLQVNPDGSAQTTGGVEGDGFIGSVGFRGNCSPLVQSLLDQAAKNKWEKPTGKLLFDKDGQYIGYQVTIKTPSGDRTVEVTGAASRALPDFLAIGTDPDTKRKWADMLREADDRDAPPESGGFNGGYASSASQAARYGRDKRAKQEAQNAADTKTAEKFVLKGTDKKLELDPTKPEGWTETVRTFLAGELGVSPDRLTVKQFGGGASGASVFGVKLGDVDLGVFKVFDSEKDAENEMAMIKMLAAQGMKKFQAVDNKSDGALAVKQGSDKGAMLMESATGRSLSKQVETIPKDGDDRAKAIEQMKADARVVAEALAEFHSKMHDAGGKKMMTPEAKAGAVNYILTKKVERYLAMFGADGKAILDAMTALGEQFKLAPIPATAYHGDANAGNFMVNDDGTVGVIDFDKMQWSLDKNTGAGIDTGAADLARFGQSLETLHEGKLTTDEADAIRAAFEKAYFAAMAGSGVTPEVLLAAKKMYAVESEIAARVVGKKYSDAETTQRIKRILGI